MVMKRQSLSKKMIRTIIGLSIVLIIGLGTAVGRFYWKETMNTYKKQGLSYAKMASEYIDGDKILSYLETEKKDAYYHQIENFLNVSQKQTDMKYYYVFVPFENDLVYIWDADTVTGACELGEHENYMEGGKETVQKVFVKDPIEEMSVYRDETYGYIGSVFYPIFTSDGEPVALVGVDLSMPDIQKNLIRFQLIVIATIVVIIALFQTFFGIFINKKIIKPVKIINSAAEQMVAHIEHGEDLEINVHTNDELEELGHAFVHMNREVIEYIYKLSEVTAEKERIGAELSVATQIQADMLPRIFPAFANRDEFEVFASMKPAKEVGGDFYDFFWIDQDNMALVIADVSGKGVPAALFMVIAKTLIKTRTQMGGTPAQILADVNNQLCEGNEASLFITVWLAIINVRTGNGVEANAGHEYPAIMRVNGDFELIKRKHSPAIAIMEDMQFVQNEFSLNPGDKIFVYTDGVPESTNSKNEMYGMDKMTEVLNCYKDKSSEEIIRGVEKNIQEFVGEAPQFDDLTMVCFWYKGESTKTDE